MRSVFKERVQDGIGENIKLWLLTHKQILPKVTKAPFVTRENGANSIMVNLLITMKSNQFVGNKYKASDFLKKQSKKRLRSWLIYCITFQAEDLHRTCCKYFQKN